MVTESVRAISLLDRNGQFKEFRSAAIKRMRFLEYLAWFRGWVSRKDLMDRFDIGPTAASSDFSTYTESYSENLAYDLKKKRYTCTKAFIPAFEHDPNRALQSLARASNDGVPETASPIPVAGCPSIQREMAANVVATISRAISTHSEVIANYTSLTSGSRPRKLVPLALVSDGFQWRVRCFDRAKGFRDYMLVRFDSVESLQWGGGADISLSDDPQWCKKITLKFRPHPRFKYRAAVISSFAFDDSELLNVTVRVAEIGYLLRQWPVDVTESALLESTAYQLHLSNVCDVREEINSSDDNHWILDALIAEQEEIAGISDS
ncbi:WYL domain-containing protein [Salinisphaera aquimarina]|uniref:WYL domain-containing protein n=1 Tax=Salinisphaera aquimarina TaxID=2094031 RepID=A0ABV7ERL4_9GAMM